MAKTKASQSSKKPDKVHTTPKRKAKAKAKNAPKKQPARTGEKKMTNPFDSKPDDDQSSIRSFGVVSTNPGGPGVSTMSTTSSANEPPQDKEPTKAMIADDADQHMGDINANSSDNMTSETCGKFQRLMNETTPSIADLVEAARDESRDNPETWRSTLHSFIASHMEDDVFEELVDQGKGHPLASEYTEYVKRELGADDNFVVLDESGDQVEDLVDLVAWLTSRDDSKPSMSHNVSRINLFCFHQNKLQ